MSRLVEGDHLALDRDDFGVESAVLHEGDDLVEHALAVGARVRDAGDAEARELPGVVVADLRDGDAEGVPEPLRDAADDLAFVLERAAVRQPQRQPQDANVQIAASSSTAGCSTCGSGGKSSGFSRPKYSRKRTVVPKSDGRPITGARPTSSMRPRAMSVRIGPSQSTPRTASMSARVTGCR